MFLLFLLFTLSNADHVVNITNDEIDLSTVDTHFFLIKGLGKIIEDYNDLIDLGKAFGNVDKIKSGTPQYLAKRVVHSPGFEDGDDHCMFNIESTEYYTNIIKEPGEDLSFGEGWHADLTFFDSPPTYSIIRGVELPGNSSRTMFKDMKMVLDDYPKKNELHRLQANHSDNFNTSTVHDVVRNGVLYVNRAFTRNIIGMENNDLLEELFDFIDNHKESETIVEWTIDDILMWDNRFVYHSAIYDYPKEERRHIQRVVVDGYINVNLDLV